MKFPSTINELIELCGRKFKDNPAISDSCGSITYLEFSESVIGLKDSLISMDVKPNDHIGVDTDGRDLIILMYALISLGAVAVAIPRGLSKREREELSDKCNLSVIVTDQLESQFGSTLGDVSGFSLVSVYTVSRKEGFVPLDFLNEEERGAYSLIRFTSGTTGSSKGVMFTEETLIQRVHAVNKGLGIRENDVVLWVLPMAYHFIVSIMLYLAYGASIVLPNNTSPVAIKDAIKKYKPTFLYATEHFYKLLISGVEKKDLDCVDLGG